MVPITTDTVAESDETFAVTLGSPTGAALLDGEAIGTIQNDDTSLRIGDTVVAEGNDGLVQATFTVTLSATVNFEVRTNFAAANSTAGAGSDYLDAEDDRFAPGQVSQTITITTIGDLRDEADETFWVQPH